MPHSVVIVTEGFKNGARRAVISKGWAVGVWKVEHLRKAGKEQLGAAAGPHSTTGKR